MDVYIYAADLYCEACGEAICEELTAEGKAPEDPDDEFSFDSGDYPKGPYPDGGGEADSPCHCGSGPDCLEACVLSDGRKVGAFLENDLTSEGVEYVKESIREYLERGESRNASVALEVWAPFYDLPTCYYCSDCGDHIEGSLPGATEAICEDCAQRDHDKPRYEGHSEGCPASYPDGWSPFGK